MCVEHAGWPLADEEFAVPFEDERNEMPGRGRFAFAQVGQFFHAVFLERDAEFPGGTNQTLRIPWCADQRAEFHQ